MLSSSFVALTIAAAEAPDQTYTHYLHDFFLVASFSTQALRIGETPLCASFHSSLIYILSRFIYVLSLLLCFPTGSNIDTSAHLTEMSPLMGQRI